MVVNKVEKAKNHLVFKKKKGGEASHLTVFNFLSVVFKY